MYGPKYHTFDNNGSKKNTIDFLKIPKIKIRDNIMKQWFSINKSCYFSLLALRFRLQCLRIHLHKRGPILPNEIYNGSTFDLNLTYEEYIYLFINDNAPENYSELIGDIMYLLCILIYNVNSNNDWITFVAIELFSIAYSLDNEKTIWYITINECNKNIDYILPDDLGSKWSKQISFKKNLNSIIHMNNISNSQINNINSLNPTNGTLDFVIISIFQLLMDPKYSDINTIFKICECDPIIFSIWRIPNEINILNRCSQIWSGQHIAYRCLTCGTTTSSCICVDCFQNGDHENHEYYIYKSDYGGCCDCGDEQAWNKSGFCNNHKYKNCDIDETDYQIFDQLSYIHIKHFFHGILCHVVCLSRLYCTAPQTKEIYLPFHSKLISKIFEQNNHDYDHNLNLSLEDNNLNDNHDLNILPNFLFNDNNINQNNNYNDNLENNDNVNIINIMNIIHNENSNSHSNHPVLLLFKENKHFQMDSFFFQWFIYLCENYQSFFMPLLGELIGSPIHNLLIYGIKYKSILDNNHKSNKYTCKLLKPLIEDYYIKKKDILNKKNNKVRHLLSIIHPEFKKKNNLNFQNSLNSINNIDSSTDIINFIDLINPINSTNNTDFNNNDNNNNIYVDNNNIHVNNGIINNIDINNNNNNINNTNNINIIHINTINSINNTNSLDLDESNSLDETIQSNSINNINLVTLVNHMNHMNLINQANIINILYNNYKCTYFPIYKNNYTIINQSNTMIDSHLLFKKDLFTYLDLFWMKWSRQLNEANESIIHQTLISKIYKQNDLTDLLLILMFNCRFKESIFPDIFLRNYNDLVQRQDKVLTRIAVQLFTIDKMLICMTLDNNLIQIIFYTTFQILQRCIFYNHGYKNNKDELITNNILPTIYSYSNTITNRKYTYSMHDSKYILQCIDLLLFIFFNKCTNLMYDELISRNITPDQFNLISERIYLDLWHNGWLALIRLVQCINPHKSRYIESNDDLKWHSSLLLCCDIQSTIDVLLQTISIILKSFNNCKFYDDLSIINEYKNTKYDLLAIYRLSVNTIQSLIQWIYIISINESWNITYEYVDFNNEECDINDEYEFDKYFLKFDYKNNDLLERDQYLLHNISIINHEVSIHIPLHRISMELLYIFLDYITTLNNRNDIIYIRKSLKNLGIINDIMKLSILEHPIRSYCFVYQAFYYNDNIWLRNGLNPINEAQFYKKSHWSTMYLLLDLFSIRLILNLLDNQDNILFLFNSILTHFDLNENEIYKDNNKELNINNYDNSYNNLNILIINKKLNKSIISSLHFLMDIITKISSIDLPLSLSFNKSIFRYLLIQYLIRKNRSRSEIQDGLPITSSSSMYYGHFIHSTKSTNLNNIIDEILNIFCDIIPATDQKPILYKIKQPLGWMLYDPLVPIIFSNDDNFINESLFSFINNWFDYSKLFDNNNDDKKKKKRRIEIFKINDHCIKDDHFNKYDDDDNNQYDNNEDCQEFINKKFSKFPMKICHIPKNKHFTSSINFYSSQNLYIKAILFCNIIHLSLPKVINIDVSQTICQDIRIIHQTFILLFNLINIEIINYFNQDNFNENFKSDLFEYKNILYFLNNKNIDDNNKEDKNLFYQYFSISNDINYNINFNIDNIESSSKNKRDIPIIKFNDDENDDYQYLIISPLICNYIFQDIENNICNNSYDNNNNNNNIYVDNNLNNNNMHANNGINNNNNLKPIILNKLNIYQIYQQLLKYNIKNIFDLLIYPIKFDIEGFESCIQYKESFCLLDILIETIYSLRIKDNDSYLIINSPKFKFVDKELLKSISLESSFFLEWGLSIAKNTNPHIFNYFNKYIHELYKQYQLTINNNNSLNTSYNIKDQTILKQKNILQEYLKKQKSFIKSHQNSFKIDLDNNYNDIEQNNKIYIKENNEFNFNDIDYCVFCHGSIKFNNENNDIATFGYLDLQNISLNPKRNYTNEIFVNRNEYISNYTSFYLTICGHFIHYKCVEEYYKLSINSNHSYINQDLDINEEIDNSVHFNLNDDSSNNIISSYFINFPLISNKNIIELNIFKDKNNNIIHQINSIKDETNLSNDTEYQNYNNLNNIYHHTCIICPYCNINSNILIPFKFINNNNYYHCFIQNEFPNYNLIQILNGLSVLKYDDILKNQSMEYNINFINIDIDISCNPIFQQLLPILNSFNYLLPYEILYNRININNISCINPISIIIKLISDNILIDIISKEKNNYSSSRYLLYNILIHSLKNIIRSFPILSNSLLSILIKKLFPNDYESNMDLWTFVILQSPSSRIQLIVNLIILLDIQNKDDIDNNYMTNNNININNNDINNINNVDNNINNNNEPNINLNITYIIIYMFLIEIFSIIWTFWNSDWNNMSEIFEIDNPIIQFILKLNKTKYNDNKDCYIKLQENESIAISFFQELINGSCFNISKKYINNFIEYRANKITNFQDSRINVNSFGAIPIQISYDDLLNENDYNQINFQFKTETNNEFEYQNQFYPNYILDSNFISNFKQNNVNKDHNFKLLNIKDLSKIINFGILSWIEYILKFQYIYFKNEINYDEFIKNNNNMNIEELIESLLNKLSIQLFLNNSLLIQLWKILTNFDKQNKEIDNKEINRLLEEILNKKNYFKLILNKRIFIPLTTLDLIFKNNNNNNNNNNININIYNENINTYYRTINVSEYEIFKKLFNDLNKRYIYINDDIIIFNQFDQSIILPPKMFHNIYNKFLSSPIKHWSGRIQNNNINQLLICLSCGSILCTEYNCCNENENNTNLTAYILNSYFYCYKENNDNKEKYYSYSIPFGLALNISYTSIPIRDHIAKCGKGLSLFLHISSSIIIAFRIDLCSTRNNNNNIFNWVDSDKVLLYGGRASEFSSLYVDEYGEEDKYLIRGKPLILCTYRWIKLQNIFQRLYIRRNTNFNWCSFQPFEFIHSFRE